MKTTNEILENIGSFIIKGCVLPLEVMASPLCSHEESVQEKHSQIHGFFSSRKPIQVADE